MKNLLGQNKAALTQLLTSMGAKPIHATTLLQAIHQHGQLNPNQINGLPKHIQQQLNTHTITLPQIAHTQQSPDGTHKWLLKLTDGKQIETVLIPETKRLTLCISSQVGCALSGMQNNLKNNNLACTFCSTGTQNFARNLTAAEIIGQLWLAQHRNPLNRRINNVVLMGMGEPLANFQHVVDAMDIMMDDHAYGLSKYRVTLSTAGILPALKRLKETSPCALAISLHAPNDELRNQIVPLNQKYPLKDLMDICKNYYENDPKRHILFEYVMLKDINDQPEHAHELVELLNNINGKVNLIPFNPFPNSGYETPEDNTIWTFQKILATAGITTTTRKTRGTTINAACGQLVGNKIVDLP